MAGCAAQSQASCGVAAGSRAGRVRRLGLAALAALAVAMPPSAPGHHSFRGEYDPNRPIAVRGAVVEFHYMNPHILIVIDEIGDGDRPRLDAEGQPIRWTAETHAVGPMRRRNFRSDSLRPGQIITIRGWVSRRSGVREMGVGRIVQESGHEFIVRDGLRYVDRVRDAAPYPGRIPAPAPNGR